MTGQLTLVETRRLLRNPYLWTVAAAALALLVTMQRNTLPNLAEVTVTAAMATFLVAAAMLVIANLATLRDQREGVPEALAALPGRPEVRTQAVLLATGCVASALTTAIIGAHLLIRLTQGPAAGRVDAREILAAAAAAAVMAVAGVALGRWVPTLIAAPAVLGMFVIGFCLGVLFLVGWLLPATMPYELQMFGRPAGLRLLYLVAVLVLLVALALLRHGRRPLRLGVAAAALAAMVPAAIGLAAAVQPATTVVVTGEPLPGEPDLECAEHNAITYCYFPGFASWVPAWARAAEPVATALPPDVRRQLPTIAQRSSDPGFTPVTSDGQVLVSMSWGRGEAEVTDRAELAGRIAGLVTGVTDPDRTYALDELPWCDGRGQVRTVVALWLAGQAAPPQPARSDEAWGGGYLERSYFGEVGYGGRELGYARELLDRADARDRIWEHWDALTDPDTTIDAALPLLGLADRLPAEPLKGKPCD